jgi:hypothetical protein
MTPGDAQRGEEGWGRYKLQQHMTELGSPSILHGVDAVLSPNRGKIAGALENRKLKPHCRPHGSLTALDDFSESLAIVRILCNWFTEVPGLTSPIVYRQCDMMRGDCASDCWPASFDSVHRCTSGGVLENNA